MRNMLLMFLSGLIISCGVRTESHLLSGPKDQPTTPTETHKFFLSTQEKLLETYPTIKKINLYEYLPHLDNLPIEYESFAEIINALEIEAIKVNANRAVLKKTAECSAQIGYCEAYLINKTKVVNQ